MEGTAALSSERMLGVIRTQTDIARLGLDLSGVMALVAERAMQLTRADGAVVELLEGEDMVYRAVSGMAGHQLGLRLKAATSLSGLSTLSGTALYCEDSETDDRVDRAACRRVGLRSMAVEPLKHDDNRIGAIKIMSRRVSAFDAEDRQILGLMSGLIAASMFHAAKYGTDALFHLATHDSLTGLANRALFFDRLRQNFAQAQRDGSHLAILNLDMDGLKPINDQFGHRVGDAALKELASRIVNTSRESDTVARLGGDEFGVILPRVTYPDAVHRQLARISEHIAAPFEFEGRPHLINASIGAAIYPNDAKEIETLIEKADQAMYTQKRARKSGSV